MAAGGGGKSTLGFSVNFAAPALAGAGVLGAGGGGGTTAASGAISTGAGGTGIGGTETGCGDSAGVEATEILGFNRTGAGSADGAAAIGATDALVGVSGTAGVTEIFGRSRMTGAASAAGAVGSAAAGGAGSAAAGGVTVESVASFGLRRSLGIVSSLMPQGLASFPPSGNKILSNFPARDLRRDKPRQSVHIFRRLRDPGAAGPPQNSP